MTTFLIVCNVLFWSLFLVALISGTIVANHSHKFKRYIEDNICDDLEFLWVISIMVTGVFGVLLSIIAANISPLAFLVYPISLFLTITGFVLYKLLLVIANKIEESE